MTTTTAPTGAFPVDWDEWREQWNQWKDARADQLGPTSYRFPSEPNFMADEVLGKFRTPRGSVELSEFTFPDLDNPGPRRRLIRHVGIVYGSSGTRETAVVASWEELDEALDMQVDQ